MRHFDSLLSFDSKCMSSQSLDAELLLNCQLQNKHWLQKELCLSRIKATLQKCIFWPYNSGSCFHLSSARFSISATGCCVRKSGASNKKNFFFYLVACAAIYQWPSALHHDRGHDEMLCSVRSWADGRSVLTQSQWGLCAIVFAAINFVS